MFDFIFLLKLLMTIYFANSSPLILKIKKTPIDFGKNFIDGKRILGDGKTIEGFLFGTFVGTIIGFLLFNDLFFAFLLSFGALLGDLIKSFFKRRLNIKRGDPFPIFDQIDFVIGSILLASIFYPEVILYLLPAILITLIAHPLANYVAYILKIKDVPW